MTAVYLPIFPLPDQTFFPRTFLPLHIFEARYRAMITDCMGRDRRLAIASLKPGYESSYDGRPPVNETVGIGKIVRCQRLPTGRFNILLHGECRARIERELPSDTLYRLVQAMPLADVGGDRPAVSALTVRVKEQCLQILEAVGRTRAEMSESLDAVRSPGSSATRSPRPCCPGPRCARRCSRSSTSSGGSSG